MKGIRWGKWREKCQRERGELRVFLIINSVMVRVRELRRKRRELYILLGVGREGIERWSVCWCSSIRGVDWNETGKRGIVKSISFVGADRRCSEREGDRNNHRNGVPVMASPLMLGSWRPFCWCRRRSWPKRRPAADRDDERDGSCLAVRAVDVVAVAGDATTKRGGAGACSCRRRGDRRRCCGSSSLAPRARDALARWFPWRPSAPSSVSCAGSGTKSWFGAPSGTRRGRFRSASAASSSG